MINREGTVGVMKMIEEKGDSELMTTNITAHLSGCDESVLSYPQLFNNWINPKKPSLGGVGN